ncbi:MAG: hypothetical protein ORO03_10700 [Alphaproteobacteria bacterium]|nr:hypothetical protein [Alphaproteobacteria bacterium]
MSEKIDLTKKSAFEILQLNASTLIELEKRKLIRTRNNPTGDFAEFLFKQTFDWQLTKNSVKGVDATLLDPIINKVIKYQIKSRKLNFNNAGERQLSAIRNLNNNQFDYLAVVLFNQDYSIYIGAIIPIGIVKNPKYSRFVEHTNSHTFHATDKVFQLPEVKDVTNDLKRTLSLI